MDVTNWGPFEWAVGGLAAVATSTIGFTWRIGTRVGSVLQRVKQVEEKQAASDHRMDQLSDDHRVIERTLAGLPGQIAERFDKRFDDLNLRIDSVLNRRP